MTRTSAGLLMYRQTGPEIEVLLVHLGGPFWQRKDNGAWVIPAGEMGEGEDHLAAAQREFAEETNFAHTGPYLPLGQIRHHSGKRVFAWTFQGDCDPASLQSNTFEIEWPPKSGKKKRFPEADRAQFFRISEAKQKILPAQAPFLDRLAGIFESKK